ncbi:MAG TPA: DUF1553 domain-containing protein [Pirellulaceae bacterium]|nr:DUF1553 domain-containing protein [Pirellulaceae bacterium]
MAWNALKPTAVKTQSGKAATTGDDATVRVAAGAATDSYTLDLPLAAGKLRALRLEALADPMAAGQGPGHAGGNFIVSRVLAAITPPAGKSPAGRFIRIEIPGKQKILSLAEVQVFDGSTNVALAGEAKQSSTDFGGPPNLAIDGKTDGRYNEGKSVTHTAISDDPWWEVDLKSIRNVDRVVLWNRTDPQTEDRLANFKLSLLDDQRQVVWQQSVAAAPKPSGEYSLSGRRGVEFNLAVADYSQPEHAAGLVLTNKDDKQKGWAVGGQTGRSHYLTLITKSPIDVADGSTLTVTIEHAAKPANHTLAAFRLSASADERAAELGRTPLAVLDILKLPADQRSAAQQEQLLAHYQSIAPALDAVRKKIDTLTKQLADSPAVTVPIMRELPATNRRVTKIQNRGNFLDLGKEVTAAVPTAFHPITSNEPVNRLTVAKWLVDENNPLTARVLANRYWEQLFGQGIVVTSEEFGSQGELPTHPELLDWLATELHRTKWDLKGFVRMIVTSATYRQSSKVTDELLARDPDNRLLARGPRFRLSAETVRDQALAVSGLLSPKMYGPPVKPPQPSSGLSAAFGSGIDWQTSGGDDKYRRGLYTTWRRSNPYPSMVTFDAPNREVCTLRRVRTNTPLQALVTLNDPVYIEAAQSLARRMIAQGGTSPAERAQYGVRLALTRPATDLELQRLVRLFEQTREKLAKSPDEAKKLATDPLGPAPAGVDVVDLAAWTVVGNVLLNLDETIMKR